MLHVLIYFVSYISVLSPLQDGENSVVDFERYEQRIDGSDEVIEMVPVKGGVYLAGSEDVGEGEGPQHEVRVGDFWMSELEITWEQYELFLYREIDNTSSLNGEVILSVDAVSGATMPYVNFNRPGHPVVNITQYAASTFCKWLSAKTGNYYRLPTEAEWEFACRAGSRQEYSFGDDQTTLEEYGWFAGNSNGTFRRGGLKTPNDLGLYDMHGNVAEWVLDSYHPDFYAEISSGAEDPVYLGDELYPRVVRGGSWKDDPGMLRCAARGSSNKSWKKRDPQFPKSLWWHTDATHVGFRVVRPVRVPDADERERLWGKPIKEY